MNPVCSGLPSSSQFMEQFLPHQNEATNNGKLVTDEGIRTLLKDVWNFDEIVGDKDKIMSKR